MNIDYTICPNCDKKLNGLMTTKSIVNKQTALYINHFIDLKKEAYCTGCAPNLISKHLEIQKSRIHNIKLQLGKIIDVLPIVTTHTPLNWDYKVRGMVSSQSVSGTGFVSELSSSVSDLFGTQSNTMGDKISSGEDRCAAQLKLKAVLLGGNAIIATDIDYAEVGGARGMLMVCMAGTAVHLNNAMEVLDVDNEKMKQIAAYASEMTEINNIAPPEDMY